jgi:hypothetical protein
MSDTISLPQSNQKHWISVVSNGTSSQAFWRVSTKTTSFTFTTTLAKSYRTMRMYVSQILKHSKNHL